MEKYLLISDCSICPFKDHSGAFDPKGTRQICGHSEIIDKRGFDIEDRVILNFPSIPNWCPLPTKAEA